MNTKGFTFIEIAVVIAVVSVLFALVSVNLLSVRGKADLTTAASLLASDIQGQQTKSMTGASEGAAEADIFGIFFNTDSYTLFKGSEYSESSENNFIVTLPDEIEISSILVPQSQLIFAKGDGALLNAVNQTYTLTLHNSNTNEEQTITINKYGVITGID